MLVILSSYPTESQPNFQFQGKQMYLSYGKNILLNKGKNTEVQ